jgi:hypothetical protein
LANFFFNRFSGESYNSQWVSYLQQKEFHSDYTESIRAQTKAYKSEFQNAARLSQEHSDAQLDGMREMSKAQADALSEMGEMITGELSEGLDLIADAISNVDNSVSNVGTMIDWRLNQLLDQQRIANLLLEDIALALRIPDVQKERQYFITQGFKHYHNATIDKDFYVDALENLLQAETRERSDYVVLHRIGMIYLYAPALVDLDAADKYFRRAAKYAAVESDPHALRTINILSDRGKEEEDPRAIKCLAADSYLQSAIACYAQGKFAEARESAGKAFDLNPQLLEAGFLKAKTMIEGDANQAVQLVEHVILAERFYSVKVAADYDLAPSPHVRNLLKRLHLDATTRAKEQVSACRAKMREDSRAKALIENCEVMANKNTYLDALTVLDMLNQRYRWKLPFLSPLDNEYSWKHWDFDDSPLFFKLTGNCNQIIDTSNVKKGKSGDTRILRARTREVTNTVSVESDGTDGSNFCISGNGKVILFNRFQREGERYESFWDFYSVDSKTRFLKVSASRMGSFLGLSYTGEYLVVDSDSLEVWNVWSQTLLIKTDQKYSGAWSFSPDETHVVLGRDQLKIYRSNQGPIRQIDNRDTLSASFSPDNRLLATLSGRDNELFLRVWRVESGTCTKEIKVQGNSGTVLFNITGTLLVWFSNRRTSAGSDYEGEEKVEMHRFDLETNTRLETFDVTSSHGHVIRAALSTLGKRIGVTTHYNWATHEDHRSQHHNLTRVHLWRGSASAEVSSFLDLEHEFHRRETPRMQRLENARSEMNARNNPNHAEVFAEGLSEYQNQKSKWFGKNFSDALALFVKAAAFGNTDAIRYIEEIQSSNSKKQH